MSGTPYASHSLATRHIDGVGRDLRVRTYDKVGEDDYGPTYEEETGSPYHVTGHLNYGGENTETLRNSRGNEVPRDVVVYLPVDAEPVERDEIRAGGHEGSAEIIEPDTGREFLVVSKGDQFDGMLRLQCTEVDNV